MSPTERQSANVGAHVSRHGYLISPAILTTVLPHAEIRHPASHELDSVRLLVQTVVDKTYCGILPTPFPIEEEDWSLAWIAVVGPKLLGMALTHENWLSDLWILPEEQGLGLGGKLLAQAEYEMASRNFRSFRLRVVKSNTKAVEFYQSRGWQIACEFQHEKLAIPMLEMIKVTNETLPTP